MNLISEGAIVLICQTIIGEAVQLLICHGYSGYKHKRNIVPLKLVYLIHGYIGYTVTLLKDILYLLLRCNRVTDVTEINTIHLYQIDNVTVCNYNVIV